ncbi:unnamed protein product [Soboliphyme baturini]|uniref:Signal recognition particle 9 kDa protein n=1 Tax=Soboliphyme baturini TaxID=241478 RepID=A0A183J7P6_9BILA|nr:unnamed protein product [Soboliphyme baturini]
MTYFTCWEEFAKAAEKLYVSSANRCRLVTKYSHQLGKLVVKITDDATCLQYSTEHAQDVKKLEKLTSNLMRQMACREHN